MTSGREGHAQPGPQSHAEAPGAPRDSGYVLCRHHWLVGPAKSTPATCTYCGVRASFSASLQVLPPGGP